MLKTFLAAYPWDLVDEGVEKVLDRLHGEVGASGVAVWVAAPRLTELRVRDVQPRVFRTRGGLFFHPAERHYEATRCKPVVSSWLKGRNPLKRIAEACADRAMELRLIVSAAMTGRLAQRHPGMACKNVFGDESQVALCLANPDVQTYLCSLVSDLTSNYPLAGLTITDFVLGWCEVLTMDPGSVLSLGETEAELLGTCFCESCHQRASAAGIDVAMARRSVETLLQNSFDRGTATDRSLESILTDNVPLAAYDRWRTEELSTFLKRMTEVCKCDLLLDRRLDRTFHRQQEMLDLQLPAAVITRLHRLDDPASALVTGARRCELRIPENLLGGSHAAEFVRTLSSAAEQGFSGVEIDNYGRIPDAALTPIKQAIRFARRVESD